MQNCVYPLDLSAGRAQKSMRFECGMLQRSVLADGKTTWHDCRCDDPDDFHALLNSSAELSTIEDDDDVFLFPVHGSVHFQTPVDLDANAALHKEGMALSGKVTEVGVRSEAKPPFPDLSVTLPSRRRTMDLDMEKIGIWC